MADLTSTRVFGDITVTGRGRVDSLDITNTLTVDGKATFTDDVDIEGNLDVDGRIASPNQIILDNNGFGHIMIQRENEPAEINQGNNDAIYFSWASAPSYTTASYWQFHPTGRLDFPGTLDLQGPISVNGNALILGGDGLESRRGLHGGYGASSPSDTDWGANIWALGTSWNGDGHGSNFTLSTGQYGLTWLRQNHLEVDPISSEGLHIYRAGDLRAAIGMSGAHFLEDVVLDKDLSVDGTTDINGALTVSNLISGRVLRLSGSADGEGGLISNDGQTIVQYSVNTGEGYPYDLWGHLVLQSRSSAARDIVFRTGSSIPQNRMVIDSSGRVGIGTVSPSHQLDVVGSGQFSGNVTLNSFPNDGKHAVNKDYVDGYGGESVGIETFDTFSQVPAPTARLLNDLVWVRDEQQMYRVALVDDGSNDRLWAAVGLVAGKEGMVEYDQIEANAIRAGHVKAAELEGYHVKAGTLWATHIRVLNQGNSLRNPRFEEGTREGWTLSGISSFDVISSPDNPFRSGYIAKAVNENTSGSGNVWAERQSGSGNVDIIKGEVWEAILFYRGDATSIRISTWDENGDIVSWTRGTVHGPAQTDWTELRTEWEVQSDEKLAAPRVNVPASSEIEIAQVIFRRKVDATLIVDGSVHAKHVNTEDLVADTGFINDLETSDLWTKNLVVDSSGSIESTDWNGSTQGWRINGNGDVTFNNGTFRGALDGASGSFTGSLSVGSNGLNVDTDGQLWIGHSLPGSAPFRVQADGTLTATSGTFSGHIDGSTMRIGSTGEGLTVSGTGAMWIGAEDYSNAPFFVDRWGNLTASNADIAGTITVGAGSNVYNTSEIDDLEDGIKADGGWEDTYTVRTADPQPLRIPNGNLLSANYSYEVTAVVGATSTNTTAVAVFENNGSGSFSVEVLHENGTNSNHPRFFLDNGVPSIGLHNHSSWYPVTVSHRRVRGRRTAGTVLPIRWRKPGTTTIDGGNIYTDTIKAISIDTQNLFADAGFIDELESVNITVDGSIQAASGNWSLTGNGTLTASNADITGKITATDGSFSGDLIVDNTITGDKVVGRTISTRHMLVGSFDNLIQNPTFQTGELFPHDPHNLANEWTVVEDGRNTKYAVKHTSTTSTSNRYLWLNGNFNEPEHHMEAQEGDEFYFTFWVKALTANHDRIAARINFKDSNGVNTNVNQPLIDANSLPLGQWVQVEESAVASAGTQYVVFAPRVVTGDGNQGELVFADFYARQMLTGKLIVDGSIEAKHIDVEDLFAETITVEGIIQSDVGNWSLNGANGKLIAADADITGKITATSGEFTGDIKGGTINIGASNAFNVDAQGNLWLGGGVYGGAHFYVKNDGEMYAENATIRGTIQFADQKGTIDDEGIRLPGYSSAGTPDIELKRSSIRWADPNDLSTSKGSITGLDSGERIEVRTDYEIELNVGSGSNEASLSIKPLDVPFDDGGTQVYGRFRARDNAEVDGDLDVAGDLSVSDQPFRKRSRTSTFQSLPSGSVTTVSYNSNDVFSNGSGISMPSATVTTIPAGLWYVVFNVNGASMGSSATRVQGIINQDSTIVAQHEAPINQSAATMAISAIVWVPSGTSDITTQIYHNSGSTGNTNGCSITVVRVANP